MEIELIPTQIEPAGPREMLIAWNHGDRFLMAYHELRFQCPCAGCVNEISGERMIERSQIAADVRPVDVQIVGRYAIKISWSDGHRTGMYAFDRLFQICREFAQKVTASVSPPST